MPRRISNAKRTLVTTFLRARRPPPGTTAAICYIHPARNLYSPPAETLAHPRSFLLPLAHASCRAGRSSCQPSHKSTSPPSTIEFTIQTGRSSPTQAAVLSLLVLSCRPVPRLPDARNVQLSLGHDAIQHCCFKMLSKYACASFTGRSPSPSACHRSRAYLKMITIPGLVLLRVSSGQPKLD